MHREDDGGRPSRGATAPAVQEYVRRAKPTLVLLPRTADWIASLPAVVRPNAVASQFPRIANALYASWHDPPAFRHLLCELFMDRRGGRKGFPLAVHTELQLLWKYHSSAFPPEWRDAGPFADDTVRY
jgi:hypothetical protein